MRLARRSVPFSDPDWQWELKWDGWRSLAFLERGKAELVSRNRHVYTGFQALRRHLGEKLPGDMVLDGEIVYLEPDGRPCFDKLTSGCRDARYVAFDCLSVAGRDLRALPLVERRAALRRLIDPADPLIRFSDDFPDGQALFANVMLWQMEGVVGKPRTSPYLADTTDTTWVKVINPEYDRASRRFKFLRK